jgi:hypothetical protein
MITKKDLFNILEKTPDEFKIKMNISRYGNSDDYEEDRYCSLYVERRKLKTLEMLKCEIREKERANLAEEQRLALEEKRKKERQEKELIERKKLYEELKKEFEK